VLFAPAGELVPVAMRALDAGGTLAGAGIHLSDIPRLDYAAALSRRSSCAASPPTLAPDSEKFLRLAATLGVRTTVAVRPFAEAGRVLADRITAQPSPPRG
jgi:alcohol dehydrogenase, propanol-preferring